MARTKADTEDIHPRSHPEDRQEGNFNPDPILEGWSGHPADAVAGASGVGPDPHARAGHGPSGEAGDDDGAGNPSPRGEEVRYGQDDADQGDLGAA